MNAMKQLVAALAFVLLPALAAAQTPFARAAAPGAAAAPPAHVKVELLSERDAIVPGEPLEIGLRMVHEPEWHSYWQVPGDSGLPTRIDWKLPPGWSAGPIEWPHPKRLPTGTLVNFGYEGETLLMVRLTPPPGLVPGQRVTLDAQIEWLECKHVCIPGEAPVQLTLPVAASSQPSASAPLFAAARKLLPQVAAQAGTASIEGDRIRLPLPEAVKRLEFFPLEEARIEPGAAQVLRTEDGTQAVYLRAAQPVAADFKTLRGVLVADGGPAQGGWVRSAEWTLVPGSVAVVAAPPAAAAAKSGAGADAVSMSLAAALGLAFLGGLILNLMPCVFPVLSLKLIHLAEHRNESGPLPAHGLAFTAGVLASFAVLAGVLIGLQQSGAALGWGFQLQTPWVVAGLAALFFLIGLNLLGVFEFTAGGGIANSAAAQRLDGAARWRGSFGTGVLAVVVASPCTAPFMGAAIGYAITQSPVVALAVFLALGLGMAAPWLALTLIPGWLRWLPRPGAWMELLRQFMAFPMFATCVWLVWVLAQQTDAGGVALALSGFVALSLAAWAWGWVQRGRQRFRWVALAGVVLALASLAPLALTAPVAQAQPGAASASDWTAWSPEALAQARAAGKPVFVDFTAAWCVTCQVNKRVALNADETRAALAREGVVLMRADWTNRDARITVALAEFGRNGVPLYLLYDRSGTPTVLPEILTPGAVIEAVDRLR
jgi:thiol:disulfide interchange protein DsbD